MGSRKNSTKGSVCQGKNPTHPRHSTACPWKEAIIDACVIDWILTAEHATNPRKAVNDLLCWQQKIALDPAISEEAARLHARIAELEAEVDRLKEVGHE